MSTAHVNSQQANPNLDRMPQGLRLSSRALTTLLIIMCVIPIATVLTLHFTMPPIEAGKLEADIRLSGHPDKSYYEKDIYERTFLPEAAIALTNNSSDTWRLINVTINDRYYVYDVDQVLEPGQQRRYLLSRFTNREGALYELRAQPVEKVVVFAKVASNRRYSKTETFSLQDHSSQ